MSKSDIGPVTNLAELDRFSARSNPRQDAEDGSLFRGFLWAAAAGMVFWIGLARLLIH